MRWLIRAPQAARGAREFPAKGNVEVVAQKVGTDICILLSGLRCNHTPQLILEN